MKRAWFSVFIIGLLTLASPTIAAFDNGNELLQHCTSQKPFAQGRCVGSTSGYFPEHANDLHLLEG